jgi:hypothetical protein
MRVLIACEYSGAVRDAFRALGHDAVSCDLLPTDRPGPHIRGDATVLLSDGWDMLIAHPPCTYLANSGVRWLYGKQGGTAVRDEARWEKMREAADLFRTFLDAPIPLIAVENPVMHKHAREIIGRGPDCTIQPWEHGHGEIKRTCFWLKGLPPLTPSNVVDGRKPRVHFASPGPDRWKERSTTLPGIAAAMAAQWSNAAKLAA